MVYGGGGGGGGNVCNLGCKNSARHHNKNFTSFEWQPYRFAIFTDGCNARIVNNCHADTWK